MNNPNYGGAQKGAYASPNNFSSGQGMNMNKFQNNRPSNNPNPNANNNPNNNMPRDDRICVFIGNLDEATTEPEVASYFSSYANVLKTKLSVDAVTGKSRRSALVWVATREEANEAIQNLHEQFTDKNQTKPLCVKFAQPKHDLIRQPGYAPDGRGMQKHHGSGGDQDSSMGYGNPAMMQGAMGSMNTMPMMNAMNPMMNPMAMNSMGLNQVPMAPPMQMPLMGPMGSLPLGAMGMNPMAAASLGVGSGEIMMQAAMLNQYQQMQSYAASGPGNNAFSGSNYIASPPPMNTNSFIGRSQNQGSGSGSGSGSGQDNYYQNQNQNQNPEQSTSDGIDNTACKIFVRPIDQSMDNDWLQNNFSSAGAIQSVCATANGYGFVTYSSPEEATKAVSTLHEKYSTSKGELVTVTIKTAKRQHNNFHQGGFNPNFNQGGFNPTPRYQNQNQSGPGGPSSGRPYRNSNFNPQQNQNQNQFNNNNNNNNSFRPHNNNMNPNFNPSMNPNRPFGGPIRNNAPRNQAYQKRSTPY